VVKKALVFLDASVTDDELIALLHAKAWDVRLAAVERLSLRSALPASPSTTEGKAILAALDAALAHEEDDLVLASIERALATRGGKS
jgi:hypothetical protein